MIGGWDREDVAAAQHALVTRELLEDATAPIGPYAAFRWAMDTIGLDHGSLLDVGCGSGHYGVLCERFYPRINYHGTDVSDYMTIYARQLAPLGRFSVCSFEKNRFADYDIVLASQVVEMLNNPPIALGLLLAESRRYVILNRIRLTSDISHYIDEATYCGIAGRNYLWNLDELTRFIEVRADIVARKDWNNQATFVIEKRDDESAKLCGCANTNGPCDCAAC